LFVDDYNSLSLTSLSLLYRYVNALYIWTLFSLPTRFCHYMSRLVTLCNEILYIICFDLYTVSMTLYDATKFNLTVTHVLYIWTLFLLLNTSLHKWSSFVTLCKELLYILIGLTYIPSLWLFLNQPNTVSKCLTFFTSGLYFTCEHVLTGMVTPSNAL
jgi:hypothetical protein